MSIRRFITRWPVAVFLFSVVLVLVLFTPWPADLLASPLTVSDSIDTADAIVVLGGGTRPSADPLPLQVKLRMERGVTLFHDGFAPTLVLSGGRHPRTGLVEADVMQDFAVALSVPESSIIKEGESRDTFQNAVNTIALAHENGWEQLAVVTSDYHTRRACGIFHELGANVACFSAPSRDADRDTLFERLTRLRGVVREYGAIIYDTVRGHL